MTTLHWRTLYNKYCCQWIWRRYFKNMSKIKYVKHMLIFLWLFFKEKIWFKLYALQFHFFFFFISCFLAEIPFSVFYFSYQIILLIFYHLKIFFLPNFTFPSSLILFHFILYICPCFFFLIHLFHFFLLYASFFFVSHSFFSFFFFFLH